MRRRSFLPVTMGLLVGVLAAFATEESGRGAAPIYGVEIPPGYRHWALISVANLGSPVNDIRAKLGNDLAIRAYQEGKTSFPDGAIIAMGAF